MDVPPEMKRMGENARNVMSDDEIRDSDRALDRRARIDAITGAKPLRKVKDASTEPGLDRLRDGG